MVKEQDFYQVSLKTILRNAQGEVLILKAPPRSIMVGWWDLPGGRIDTDEFAMPFSEIIARELEEEIGPIRYTLHGQPLALGRREVPPEFNRHRRLIRQLFVFFDAEYHEGAIRISHEHTEYQWLDIRTARMEDYFTDGILEGMKTYMQSTHP